jgi:hypothetical protein
MAEQTYVGSRLRAGETSLSNVQNGGDVSLSQTALVVAVNSTNADAFVDLPPGAQILSVQANKQVTQAGGTATTLLVTAGNAAGGGQYLPSTDLFTNTNAAGPSNVATNLAAANIGANTRVHLRVAANGTMTTAAQVRFTVTYAMRS